MYSDVVGRTQIYLNDGELDLLDRMARSTGASRSELVRRAVRSAYGKRVLSTEERVDAIRASAGIWKDRPFTGAEYVDAIRGDLNDRLRKLGID